MKFQILPANQKYGEANSTVYLTTDHWNDFSFVTQFYLRFKDGLGEVHDIGRVKIAFKGQTTEDDTYKILDSYFEHLPETYFSLADDGEYYERLYKLPIKIKEDILKSLNDLSYNPDYIKEIENEEVFTVSLLRSVNLSTIKGQFNRILNGQPPLTDFKFCFKQAASHKASEISLDFKVNPNSKPSTNIHAIIGRNGVGKTTLLNNMVGAILSQESEPPNTFMDTNLTIWKHVPTKIEKDYFSSLISVSFSAFDPFEPPQEQPNPAKGTCYFYVGLKPNTPERIANNINSELLKDEELRKNCAESLMDCFRNKKKAQRWRDAIKKLSSDANFDDMNLTILEDSFAKLRATQEEAYENNGYLSNDTFSHEFFKEVDPYLKRMSAGHKVVFLTITRLIAKLEEKVLILLDEPESHLHPPLLSAFVRALSELLYDCNGVAIVATHSPVVLQEIPKSCVWTLNRTGSVMKAKRPDLETFGENVGTLTREVFRLEVSKSGFHDLLTKSVSEGGSYQEILESYGNQIGVEGRILLKTLITNRDSNN